MNTSQHERPSHEPRPLDVDRQIRRLLEDSEDVILLLDTDGRIRYYNGPRRYGRKAEDLVGTTACELFPPAESEPIRRQVEDVLATGESSTIEVRLTWNGEEVWFSDHAVPLHAEDGRIIGIGKICRNITALKRAEQSLAAAQAETEKRIAERTADLEAANARLAAENQKRIRTEAMLARHRDLGLALATATSLRSALDLVLDAACQIDGIDAGGIYLREAKTGDLKLETHRGLSAAFVQAESHIDRNAPHVQFIRSGRPAYRDTTDMSFVDDALGREGIRALGVVPILHEGEVIGCLNVASRHRDEFSLGTRYAVETLAAQIGPVLDRVQSRDRLEELVSVRTRELTELNRSMAAEIAARTAAETALRVSEHRYRTLVEAMSEGVCLVDRQDRFAYVNERFCQMIGRPASELVGFAVPDRVAREDRMDVEKALADRRRGIARPYEYTFRRPDGSTLDALISPKPLFDEANQYVGDLVVCTDITDRKKMEAALRESETRYRRLVETMREGLCELNENYEFTYVNPAYCEITGRRADELIGRPAFACFRPEDVAFLKAQHLNRQRGSAEPFEFRYHRPDGTYRDALVRPSPLFDDDERYLGSVGVVTDITDLKRAAELEAANTALAAQIAEEQRAQSFLRLQRDLAVALGSATDTAAALEAVLKAACGVEDIDCGGVYVTTADGLTLQLVTRHNLPDDYARAVESVPLDNPIARRIQSGEPVYSDSDDLAPLRSLLEQAGIRSAGVIPVIHNGRLMASLSVGSTRSDGISASARYTLEGLAAQIAPVLERVSLHESLERRVEDRTRELQHINRSLLTEIERRTAAEEELRRRQEEFRTLVENAPDVIARFDRNLRLVYANHMTEVMVGRPSEALTGKTYGELGYPPDLVEERERHFRKVLETGTPHEFDTIGRTVRGPRHFNVRVVPERNEASEVATLLVVARDIHDRRQAEAALLASREAEKALAERLSRLVDVTNRLSGAGSRDELSRLAVELGRRKLGFDRLGLYWLSEDRQTLVGSFGTDEKGNTRDERSVQLPLDAETLEASASPAVWKRQGTLYNDRHRPVGEGEIMQTPVWEGGRASGFLFADNLLQQRPFGEADARVLNLFAASLAHLNARLRTQDQLKASEAQLRGILRAIPDMVLRIRSDGTLLSYEPARDFEPYCPPEQFLGRKVDEVLPLDAAVPIERKIRQAIRTGKVQSLEYHLSTNDTARDYEARLATCAPDEVVAIVRDITEQKAAREALLESEQRFRSIVQASPIGILLYEMSGTGQLILVDSNPAASQILGVRLRRRHGLTIEDAFAGLRNQPILDHYRRAVEQGVPFAATDYSYDSEGVKGVFDVQAFATSPGRLCVLFTDVTEQRAAAAALRESEARYRTLAESADDHIFIMDEAGRLTYVNPAAARDFLCRPGDLLGKCTRDLFPSRYAKEFDAVFREVLSQGKPVSITQAYPYPSGPRWMSLRLAAIPAADGAPRYVLGIARDVSELKQAEEAIRVSEQRYRTLAETAEDAIFIIGRDHRIQYVNSNGAALFRATPEQLVGRRNDEVFPPEVRRRQQRHLRTVFRTGQPAILTNRLTFPAGEVWLATRLTPMKDPAGKTVSVLGIARDVTDLKRNEDALRRNEETERAFRKRLAAMLTSATELSKQETEDALCRRAVEVGVRELGFECLRLTLLDPESPRVLRGTYGTDRRGRVRDERNRRWPLPRSMRDRKEGGLLRFDRRRGRGHFGRPSGILTCPLAAPLTDGTTTLGWLGGGDTTNGHNEGYEGELLQLYASLIASLLARQRSARSYLEHVRKLSREAERNLEEWQARVARELHDELGQLLTAINMELKGLERHGGPLDSTGQARLQQALVAVRTAMTAVRDLSRGLRPPIIEREGLSEAIRSYVSEFQRYAGVLCRLRIDPAELEGEDPYATAVYRIVQEALTNVARHAQASACSVSLRLLRTGKLQVRVRDNGVGAPPGAISQRETLGVIGMKERASSLGGSLSITSQQGRGVCITAILPWPK